jgi:hypothetical protein
MRALLRTLLVIALLVQLPMSALAVYSGMNHSHQHTHEHHHGHAMGELPDTHAAEPTDASDENQAANECVTHSHCGVTHLTALPASRLQHTVIHSRQIFGTSSDILNSSAAHTRIERPNWASL